MTGKILSYRDLKVWQKAVDLAVRVYTLLKRFPLEERFGLASQVRRAAVSVPANIAEGHARQHPKEYLQGLYMARGSLAELETHLEVAGRLGYIPGRELLDLAKGLSEVRRLLQRLINSQAAKSNRRPAPGP